MPSLKAIRKRIASVKSTQKITRAMKMVAAARLRRAQQRIVELRPFAKKTRAVLRDVTAKQVPIDLEHPLLAVRPEKDVVLVVLASDRGLAGGFNSNVNRAAEQAMKKMQADGKRVALVTIGRRARDYFRRRGAEIIKELPGVSDKLDLARADEIAAELVDLYVGARPAHSPEAGEHSESHAATTSDKEAEIEQQFDAIYLVYNEFKSAMSQLPQVDRLLPMREHAEPGEEHESVVNAPEYLFEPSRHALLDSMLPLYVQITVYRALLESVASFFGAQMTAMDAATNNAKDMISRLTLDYNRARQAAITKELMEIISGAEALK
jgi:F-type H+-transporting ATPase subunit gamma